MYLIDCYSYFQLNWWAKKKIKLFYEFQFLRFQSPSVYVSPLSFLCLNPTNTNFKITLDDKYNKYNFIFEFGNNLYVP